MSILLLHARPELSAAQIPNLNLLENLRGESDKRQQVIEPTVRAIGAGVGDVAEADSGVQRPSCGQIIGRTRVAPHQKIQIRSLLGKAAVEIRPERTAAAIEVGLQRAERGERIDQFWCDSHAISTGWLRDS